MFRLFSFWVMATTKLTINYEYKADIRTLTGLRDTYSHWKMSFDNQESSTEIYEIMKDNCKIDVAHGESLLESSTSITLTGKLNGIDVDEHFGDLESYRNYLEENSFMSKPTNEIKLT